MTAPSRPTLLFICPIMPQQSGNGLAMRAALMLQGFARRFDVHLFVAPISGGSLETPEFVRTMTRTVGILDLGPSIDPLAALIQRIADPVERRRQHVRFPRPWASRFSGDAAARQAIDELAGTRIDVVHVMRLALAPLAMRVARTRPTPPLALLDLDDDDIRVHERLAELHQRRDESEQAHAAQAQAAAYLAFAPQAMEGFAAVLTASDTDARRLAAAHPAVRFEMLQNGYAADRAPSPHGRVHDPLRLLFVANLGYVPNADAAAHLIDDILPALAKRGVQVHLDIVGPGAIEAARGQAGAGAIGTVALRGAVEDVAAWYAQADIAIVPLRAGGGTRIKILEAFAYGVPVVSSSIGAEGLDVTDGVHLMIADGASDIAAACMRLAADPEFAADLAANAYAMLQRRHTPERVHATLDAILDSLFAERAG